MYAKDFTYDGTTLSSLGYMLCDFGNGGDTRQGSNISFTTVPVNKGQKVLAADAKYENCLTTTLYICKNICNVSNQENLKLSPSDVSTLSRWLNKKSFRPLIFDATGWTNIVFEASFNISAIEIDGDIFGLELEMVTNRPFATIGSTSSTLTFTAGALSKSFVDTSDEIGFIYPDEYKITLASAGDLTITNLLENRTTIINNCVSGEVITINYPMISSSVSTHKIQDDFNFIFPRVANTATQRTDTITVSLPCTIQITYKPIIKIAL